MADSSVWAQNISLPPVPERNSLFTLGSTESQSLSDSALCREIPGAPASLCRTSAPDGYRRKAGSSCSTVLKTALLAYCECCGNFNFKIIFKNYFLSVCVRLSAGMCTTCIQWCFQGSWKGTLNPPGCNVEASCRGMRSNQ